MTGRLLVAALSGFAALVGGGGAVSAQDSGNKTFVFQDYPGPGNLTIRIAIAKGLCEKHNVTCELKTIPTAPLGVQALLTGGLDVGIFTTETTIPAVNEGAPLEIISGFPARNAFQMAVSNEVAAAVDTNDLQAVLESLKGKRIGVPARGSGAELLLLNLMDGYGLSGSDYTIVANGGPVTAYGALASGQVDASMTFEPVGAICDVLETCKLVYEAATAPEPENIARTRGAFSQYVMLRDVAKENADAVQRMLAAASEVNDFLHAPENFDEVMQLAAFRPEMNLGREKEQAIAETSMRRQIEGYTTNLDVQAIQVIADNMLAARQISEPFDISCVLPEGAH